MSQQRPKTVRMQLIERDFPGKTIEEIMLSTYAEHGSERAAARALGITQQAFNTWKFRLNLEDDLLDYRQQWLEDQDDCQS